MPRNHTTSMLPVPSVHIADRRLLAPSPLGLRLIDSAAFDELSVASVARKEIRGVWTNRLYKKEVIVDRANEMLLEMSDRRNNRLNLRGRV